MTLLNDVFNNILPILLGLGGVFGLAYFKNVVDQKKRNVINEIDLTAQKIKFENDSKPINTLLDESNKSHGADGVVKASGSNDPKG